MFGKKIFHAHAKVEQTEQEPTDYNDLFDKPHINNVLLTGNKTSNDLNLVSTDNSNQTVQGDKTFKNGIIVGQVNGSRTIRISYAPDTDGKQYVAVGNSAELPLAFKVDVDNEETARVLKDNELQEHINNIKISNMPDVELTTITDGEVLIYDLNKQKWINSDKEKIFNNSTEANALAIGQNAKATAEFACQIGAGTNNTTKTLNFLGYRILEEDGRIPNTRLRNCAIPDWANSEVRLNDTEYIAETDGTLFIQADLGSWCYFIVNGYQYPIGGSVGGHMFDFRIGKGDKYKFKAGNTTSLSLLWTPDKGQ